MWAEWLFLCTFEKKFFKSSTFWLHRNNFISFSWEGLYGIIKSIQRRDSQIERCIGYFWMIFFKESSPVFFVQVDRNHLILHSCEEFTNRSLFSNNSRIDNRHIPTETFCLFEIMSGEYNRNTGFVHFSKKCIHAMAKLKINSCCRFIKNKDHRIMYKGACDHKSSYVSFHLRVCVLEHPSFPKDREPWDIFQHLEQHLSD